MDTTISWMIGNRPATDPIAERRYAHLRALREARRERPAMTSRIGLVLARLGIGSARVATPAGANLAALDTVCCTA
jgi:hypothetical protein